MPDPKGSRLYVNLGPSQVKRRLKGFGHGVKKGTECRAKPGRHYPTATGRHLEKSCGPSLRTLFFQHREHAVRANRELAKPGPGEDAEWLRDAGITTVAELARLGPVLAYRLVKQKQPRASLNLLWALAAGLSDLDWRELSESDKHRLQAELVAD